MDSKFWQRWYTRIVGVLFVFVLVPLINEAMNNGNTPELWHKAFHVILGSLILHFGWDNEKFSKIFCIANGAFFFYVALFGWVFPNFAGLDAFNLMNSVIYSIIGGFGLIIGFLKEDDVQLGKSN